MERSKAIQILQAHEQELRAAGVLSASLFGSVARGEPHPQDVDIAVRLGENFAGPGIAYFGGMHRLRARLSQIFGCIVDVIEEPVRKERIQREIDRDRTIAF